MKPISLRVKNYAKYNDETFNFEEAPNLFAIIGTNGAGKSTFFVDAILTALFNQSRTTPDSRGTGIENMIQTSCEFFETEFVFQNNGQVVSVLRRRYEKKQELELKIDGIDHTEKIKETQEKINNIIKMDYDTFLDTVCIGQGKSGSFMEKKPDKRKEVFTKVLGLDNYDVLEEEAKELRKQAKNELSLLEVQLEGLEDSVKVKEQYENQISQAESSLTTIEIDIATYDELLEKELADKVQHESLAKQANEFLARKNNLSNQVNTLATSIQKGENILADLESKVVGKEEIVSEMEQLSSSLDTLQNELTEYSNEKSSLQAKNEMFTRQGREIKAKHTRLEQFNEADCEFCGQPVTDEHKAKHLNQLVSEAKVFIKQINTNKSRIEELDNLIIDTRNILSQNRSRIQQLQNQKSLIEQSEAKIPGVKSRLEELGTDLLKAQSEYDEISNIEVQNVEHKTFRDIEYRSKLNSLRNQLSQFNTQIGIANNELKRIMKDAEKIKNIESKVKETKKMLTIYDDLATAYGKKGIQAVIIDNQLDPIQDEINKFLEMLTDGKVSIEFKTQKDKGAGKKATSIETLDIIVNDEDGSRIYESYSGGEKFRIDFACHVGLAKFLSKRAGAPIDFFIIDEGVGSQDQEARDNFIIAVNKLTTIFDKVMVITHIPDVIEAFQNKVEVYPDPVHGSKIKVIGG